MIPQRLFTRATARIIPRQLPTVHAPRTLATSAAAMSAKDPIHEAMDATKVDYVRLGRSGLRVSVPIFGAMSLGSKDWVPWVVEGDEAMDLLKAAYDRGLNTWDTANMYSNGHSEVLIAKAMKKFDIPRHKVVILTKCCMTVGETPATKVMGNASMAKKTKDYVNQYGLSRGAIFNAVDASLKRLETDYIDLLQIHRFDDNTPIEETMKALHDLVQSGKVRYIGASTMWAYQFVMMQECAEKHGWTKFVSMQNHYNLVYREEEREMNKYCRETGVGLIPWGPLHAGMLARPIAKFNSTKRSEGKGEATEQQNVIARRVEELAQKKGWLMSHVALAWAINPRRGVTSPIVGFSSVQRIEEGCDLRGKSLTDEEMDFLEEPYKALPSAL